MVIAGYRRLRWAASALCCGIVAVPAFPAGAGSVYLNAVGIGGGAVTMKVESFQEKKYNSTLAQQVRERFASGALDDSRLGEIRGGFDTSSGLVVNFSFQEATYVNHNLAQSILIPTLTVSPGLGAAVPAGNFVASAVVPRSSTARCRRRRARRQR